MSHRILVIDHHPQGLQCVVNPLRKAGYEVSVAQSAADGASSFGRLEPDLVLIAARLPRTHGTVLCRELKRTDSGANTPIVLIIEGTGVQIDLPPLDQFGADQLIQKPFTSEELLRACHELLNPEQSHPGRRASDQAAEADDGLSTALEELDALEDLDALEFDLPSDVIRVADVPPVDPAVPLSSDYAQDIENHIDDLFSAAEAPPPAPPTEPEPSTGRDNDADSAVLTELDLDDELNKKLVAPRRPAARVVRKPATPPAVPSATATVARPVAESGAAAGRFQTEALTRDSAPSPATPTKTETRAFTLPRWSWVAIPVTAAVVAMAAFIMLRQPAGPTTVSAPIPSPPSTGGSETTPGSAQDAATGFALPTLEDEQSGGTDVPAPEPGDAEPAAPVVTRRMQPPPREPDPEPQPEPVVRRAASRPAVVEPPKPAAALPVEPAPPKPVTPAVAEPPAESATDPTTFEPEPSMPEVQPQAAEVEPEPSMPEVQPQAAEVEPEPSALEVQPQAVEVEPEPVTRDPILTRHVEPRVSAKDLRKGGGTVVLKVLIDTNGAVTRVLVEQGLPGSPLEGAAVAAVLRWRYEPALDRDEPVAAWTTARFTFGD